MHSYPAWKIWLVVIVLLVGTVLALPNVFGEAPALQLSRNDRTAVTDDQRQHLQQRIRLATRGRLGVGARDQPVHHELLSPLA
jgi:preprotein translocase subunit SecD